MIKIETEFGVLFINPEEIEYVDIRKDTQRDHLVKYRATLYSKSGKSWSLGLYSSQEAAEVDVGVKLALLNGY